MNRILILIICSLILLVAKFSAFIYLSEVWLGMGAYINDVIFGANMQTYFLFCCKVIRYIVVYYGQYCLLGMGNILRLGSPSFL